MGKRGPGAKPIKLTMRPENRTEKRHSNLSMPERVIAFAEALPITSGTLAGQKMHLRDWQKAFIHGVYGPQKQGRRVVRTALLSLPRKNGKTQLAAMLALAHLCGPCSEMRGQVYSAASDRNQASIIFREMVAVIERTHWMTDRLNIRSFNKLIEDYETGSTYEALSSDARKAHGLSPSFVVCDELAQWRGRELYDNLLSGMGARDEPLCICIGTQAADDQNLMSELVDYAEKIHAGELSDPSFLGVVYKAPDDADPWDEKTWYACNPALGDFRSLEDMRIAADRAQKIPAQAQTFKNLFLNMRVAAEVRFIPAADWKACGEPVDVAALYGRPCYAGLDLASTTDLTACILFFPHDGGAVLPFFWCPGDNMQARSDTDRVPYTVWAEQGFIEATPGRAVNKLAVVRRLAQIAADYDVQGIGFDRWRIEDVKRIMADEGIALPLVGFGQGFKDLAPAVDALEAAILDGGIRHGNHPVLTWNCSNACIETDPAGNRKLSKRRSREKIDGMVALAMAVGLHCREEAKPPAFDPESIMLLSW
jgi:phage terminase large subunit-like protein